MYIRSYRVQLRKYIYLTLLCNTVVFVGSFVLKTGCAMLSLGEKIGEDQAGGLNFAGRT